MDALICDTTPRHAHFHFLTSWDVFALICPCGVYVHLCWIFSHPCLAFFRIFPSVLASDFFPSFWFYRFLFFWISFSLVPVYLLIHCVETSCWLLEEGISALQTHEKSKLDLLKHDHSLKMKSRMGYREQYFNKIHLVSL